MAETMDNKGKESGAESNEYIMEDEMLTGSDGEEDMSMEESGEEEESAIEKSKVYLPHEAYEGELEVDLSTYDMLHSLNVEWPSLSFDFIHDTLGENRTEFPATCYLVAGSQADVAHNNQLTVMKLSNLTRTKIRKTTGDDMSSDSDDSSTDEDESMINASSGSRRGSRKGGSTYPVVASAVIRQPACINRVRVMPQNSGSNVDNTLSSPSIVAVWREDAELEVLDVSVHLASLDAKLPNTPPKRVSPLHTFSGHQSEGYALDWSTVTQGRLASGDIDGKIHIWSPKNNAVGWTVDAAPLVGHGGSVEDIQWSPSEANVLCSASADATVAVWDIRKKKPALQWTAHTSDANVLSWNPKIGYLLVSGGDDGAIHVWDLRMAKSTSNNNTSKSNTSVATFKWHTAPVTSIEWSPHDEAVFAASGADNQTTIWDLSVEPDTEQQDISQQQISVPPQLLFVHQGQTDVKELHWHKQSPGFIMTTSLSGLNYFKTISI